MADTFVRINGSIHLNHIEAKHGDINFVQIAKQILPYDKLNIVVLNNNDRYASTSSIILSIYGDVVLPSKPQQLEKLFNKVVNNLKVPVESAIFDVCVHNNNEIDQSYYVMNINDGIVHKAKLK